MRFRYVAALLVFLLSNAGIAMAQETTGKIQGRIVDAQTLAVPGVNVTANGPQGSKSTTSDTDGRFAIVFLTPGMYAIRVELQGFKPIEQKNINVGLGQTVDLSLKLEVGGVNQVVEVIGASPMIDRTTTTTGAVLTSETFDQVPVGRRVSDTLYMAPGVSSSDTAGHANPSISGGSGLDNQYLIDGVNVTNSGYGALGSYSIIFGSLGNATPFDFVKEVQVKTGGYEAEFGQSTGGVINVVTKSGTNDFHGSIFGFDHPAKTESTWTQIQTPNGTVQTSGSHGYDGGAEGGGPIVRNHVFFFGAIDPSRDIRTFVAPQGFPLTSLGGVDRTRDSLTYAAKGTVQLTSSHRIDASFFGDPSTGLNGAQRAGALLGQTTSSYSALSYGGHNQTVRYSGVPSSRWLVEASFARALNNVTETPSVDAWQVRDTTVVPNLRTGGIGFYEKGNNSLSKQWTIKSTNIVGGHSIKYGFEYDDVSWTDLSSYTGPTFTAPDGRVTATGNQQTVIPDPVFGKIYRVVRARFTTGSPTTQKDQDFFAQDTWKIGDRLTVNPGIRYEQETMNGKLASMKLTNNWAPRIGATYAITGDGKTKVYANWGRFFERLPNDLAARVLTSESTITQGDYFDSNLTKPVPPGTLVGASQVPTAFKVSGGTSTVDVVDPNAKMSYSNAFVVGVEREVMANTSFGVRYIYKSIGRLLEDIGNCPMAAYDLNLCPSGVGNNLDGQGILTNPSSATPLNAALVNNRLFAGVGFPDPVHKYQAVEVTLNRRFTNNWSALASYRWSRLRGNFEGSYEDLNGQSDPGITTLFDFPQNDPTYTSIGVPQFGYPAGSDIRYLASANGILPLDRPNQFKLYANYMFHNLNLGVAETGSSGAPLTPLAPNPQYGNGGEMPTAPLGGGFQTVNGFVTRTPFETQTDFQAAYSLSIGGMRKLTLLAEIFNLFDQKTVENYDNYTALAFGAAPNPNFGQPTSQIVVGPQIQAPRQIRLGVRFNF